MLCLLNITHHRSQRSTSAHETLPSQRFAGELPGDFAAIESAEKRFQQLSYVDVSSSGREHTVNDEVTQFNENQEKDKERATTESITSMVSRLYLSHYQSVCRQQQHLRLNQKTDVQQGGSTSLAWLLASTASSEDGAKSALSMQPSVSLADQLRLIVASSLHIAAPYHLPVVDASQTSKKQQSNAQSGGSAEKSAVPSALEFCLQKRRAALVEVSESPRDEASTASLSTMSSYLAVLPLALTELYQQAFRASQDVLVETGDADLSLGMPRSLMEFLLAGLRGNDDNDDENETRGSQQPPELLSEQFASVVMLLEPLLVGGGSVLGLGGAVKRLRFHFRRQEEIVTVAVAGGDRTGTLQHKEREDSSDAQNTSDNDDDNDSTPSPPPPSLLSQASPQHFLSYALGLAHDVVAESFETFLSTLMQEFSASSSSSSKVLLGGEQRHVVEKMLTSRVAAITGVMYWSTVLRHFADSFQWKSIVTAILSSSARSSSDSKNMARSKRQFLHLCNCLFDLVKQCSAGFASAARTTTGDSTAAAASHLFSFRAGLSSVVAPLTLKELFTSSNASALRLWSQCQVEHLLDVCSSEASAPSLWRREFLVASRRTDHIDHASGDEQGAASSRLAHHAVSPVVVKFFRGLSAAVCAIQCILVGDEEPRVPGVATDSYFAPSRIVVWRSLVCRGVLSFASQFDVSSSSKSNHHHLMQTAISDHIDRLYDMLHMKTAASVVSSHNRNDENCDEDIMEPAELLAAMFLS
ncbi:Hypothetical protein, putative [Bodo saltans]|uniref:Uncharacterized protein n=1 Tax=Bodo saltans TaxID=75058 RepID=A0A0S4J3M6_BODSA|nr:Hypothetical protein, putative [Bodo saltans]|eukprot:CUG59933.1 Hypothetical protein, putative [Bodo saltans]